MHLKATHYYGFAYSYFVLTEKSIKLQDERKMGGVPV